MQIVALLVAENHYLACLKMLLAMKLRFFLIMICVFVLSAGAVFAQGRVSGIVKDRAGEPLIGANVIVKGTTISTITGPTGEFQISAASDAVLVISYEGYMDLEVAVADLPTADLQLKPAILSSIGSFYGNDNFYALTTASTLIQIDDIETGLETDIHQFLLGKVPGLEVVPDASGIVHYRMRGGDSPTDNLSEPLFVVDGMYDYYGGLSTVAALNPNDIESIRVLKDIPATAQYGEMGRNGVIVIKTRQPSDKMLAVSYDGNGSLNTCDNDDKWKTSENIDPDYKNSFSTKHNLAVRGLAGPMPYRAALGYNSINSILGDNKYDRLSGSVWLGPSLLDKHLKIDFNAYYKKITSTSTVRDYYNDSVAGSETSKSDFNRFSGVLKADYSVHSFEDLHLNLTAGYNSDLDGSSALMLDGNVDINHQFGKKYYLELKVGAALNNYDYKDIHVLEPNGAEHSVADMTALYGQLNVALNRYFMNVNTRLNMHDSEIDEGDYNKMTTAVSLGVKVASSVTLHSGFGISGVTVGHRPDGISNFDAFTYNLGIDRGNLKSKVYGSLDFYIHHNEEPYYDYMGSQDYKTMSLTNVGADFRIGAKLIDTDVVKWRIGANLGVNGSIIVDSDDYEELMAGNGDIYVTDDKPLTYSVFEQVYDKSDNLVPNMFIDQNNDGYFDNKDRKSSELSPVPSVVGGFNTYFEVMGGYLHINAHGSADRYNLNYNAELSYVGQSYLPLASDIHNSSFLRIDNIVLGYRFTDLWLFSGRAYAAVENPFVVTKYDGRDPEIYDGIDYSGICQRPRIFSIGVKLNINIKD